MPAGLVLQPLWRPESYCSLPLLLAMGLLMVKKVGQDPNVERAERVSCIVRFMDRESGPCRIQHSLCSSRGWRLAAVTVEVALLL